MEEESTSLSTSVSEGILRRVLGPAADEVGLILKDKVHNYRQKNLSKVVSRAIKIIDESGIEPNEIPLRTLIPIIERASVEDDEYLSEKWSRLFASASASQFKTDSHPCFPQILSELSPLDVLLLDRLWEPGRPKSWNDFKKQQLENGIDQRLLSMTFASLDRAGLCTNSHEYYFTELGKAFMRAVTGSAGDC
ncbi:protein of unknown function [Pantoea sesami]|nr:protein of unknown function [Pantoea sesami]